MNPGTWEGTLFWCCIVAAFILGSRWGRARERVERDIAEQHPSNCMSHPACRTRNGMYS